MSLFNQCRKIQTNAGQSVRGALLWLKQGKIRTLLACEELRQVEQPVSQRRGLPLLSCPPICANTNENWLCFAGISHEDARKWLASDREALIEFCVAVGDEFKDDDPDGEFPEGEEPDEADKGRREAVLGYSNGGALMSLCWYVLLKTADDRALDAFLDKTRMPFRKQLAKRLRQVYDKVMSRQPGGSANASRHPHR